MPKTADNNTITSPKMSMFIECMFIPCSDTFGNGTESARAAKYKGNDNVLAATASRLLRNVKIIEAKEAIEADLRVNHIATRSERQEFWTKVYLGTLKDDAGQPVNMGMNDRLRASELLGKSEADFIDVLKSENKVLGITVQVKE